jgi:hypothetical protein
MLNVALLNGNSNSGDLVAEKQIQVIVIWDLDPRSNAVPIDQI